MDDIQKLRKILVTRKRSDLADLLIDSHSCLNKSGSYGSMLYSILSTFEIYSSLENNDKLLCLNDLDKKMIYDAVLLIYPLKDNSPEIHNIEYRVDFSLTNSTFVDSLRLEDISFDYVKEQISKCENKITEKDYEGAITNARNLIESICLFILESMTENKYNNDGNLIKLYKKVSDLLKLNPADYSTDSLRSILSGLISIVNGISSLRNNFSDAHGGSPSTKKYRIDERHAILAVNSAKTISEYLY